MPKCKENKLRFLPHIAQTGPHKKKEVLAFFLFFFSFLIIYFYLFLFLFFLFILIFFNLSENRCRLIQKSVSTDKSCNSPFTNCSDVLDHFMAESCLCINIIFFFF